MDDRDLAFTPGYRQREMIASKEISPVELTELYLRRIEELNPRLNAFLTVASEQAMEEARRAEQAVAQGDDLGPLHGVAVSIKDLASTRGIRTTRGSLVYEEQVPDEDDIFVERLRQAGAIILGKTNTPEFGEGGGVTENRLGPNCNNPWNPQMTSGASSGGAGSSVAAGLNPIAHGSDGAGSIRIPSAFCGIYGIMATQGRVPRRETGLMSWSPVDFSRDGPMTRTVRDAALFLNAVSGPHPRAKHGTIQEAPPDFTADLGKGLNGLRIAWSPDLGSVAVDAEVRSIAERGFHVLEELGAEVTEARFHVEIEALNNTLLNLRGPASYLANSHLLEEWGDRMMPYIKDGIERGGKVTGAEYARALAELERLRAYVDAFFKEVDLLVTPAVSVTAFPGSERPTVIDGRSVDPMSGWYGHNFPFNMSGNPAASVPCGFAANGLPVGMQIVGAKGEENTVLRASAAFEEARPWADARPPVS